MGFGMEMGSASGGTACMGFGMGLAVRVRGHDLCGVWIGRGSRPVGFGMEMGSASGGTAGVGFGVEIGSRRQEARPVWGLGWRWGRGVRGHEGHG